MRLHQVLAKLQFFSTWICTAHTYSACLLGKWSIRKKQDTSRYTLLSTNEASTHAVQCRIFTQVQVPSTNLYVNTIVPRQVSPDITVTWPYTSKQADIWRIMGILLSSKFLSNLLFLDHAFVLLSVCIWFLFCFIFFVQHYICLEPRAR
jgi:hypothetical protein